MQSFVRRLRKDQTGFTLIELLVVVAILALLGAVAIPRIVSAQTNAKTRAAEANKGIIEAAIEQYYIMSKPNAYPVLAADATESQLETLLGTTLEIKNFDNMLDNFTVTYVSADGTTYTLTVAAK